MKLLVVAHPDDEILWFNPEEYDKIMIVFGKRKDKSTLWNNNRKKTVENHPLKDKIIFLDMTESNYWRDPTQEREYFNNYVDLCLALKQYKPESVMTHDANGEYGHADHKLCFNACMDTFDCPVNGKNTILYRKIKKHYQSFDCWTW